MFMGNPSPGGYAGLRFDVSSGQYRLNNYSSPGADNGNSSLVSLPAGYATTQLDPVLILWASATSATIYWDGGNSGALTISNPGFANIDNFTEAYLNSTAATGSITVYAEYFLGTGTPDSTQRAALLTRSQKVEEIAGLTVTRGWALNPAGSAGDSAGSTLAALVGSTALTNYGMLIAADAHPVSRGGGTAVSFAGTIPALNGTVGTSFAAQSPTIASYFSGTLTPFAYTLQSGTLPAGLTLNSSTGVISGTPTTAGTTTGLVIRATDASSNTANSNSFSIVIAPPAATSMTIALKQSDGTTPAASITGIEYAILNAATVAAATAVLDTGTGESTDGSGNLVLDLTGLGLTVGQVRYVVAGKSNGTPGANFDGWQGPATAA
jgi:hypothetical protein